MVLPALFALCGCSEKIFPIRGVSKVNTTQVEGVDSVQVVAQDTKKKWLSPLFGAIIPPNCLYLLYIIYRDSGDIAEKSHKCAKKFRNRL